MEHPLDALFAELRDKAEPKISPFGQIARLREYAERLKQPNPFEPGDLVTPRAGVNIRGIGDPHLVIALCAPFDRAGGAPEDYTFARQYDMKIACIMRGHEVTFYQWSGDYERYTGDGG